MKQAERRNMMSLAELPVTSLAGFERLPGNRKPEEEERRAAPGSPRRGLSQMEEDRIFARILVACYAATMIPFAAWRLIPVFDVAAFIVIPFAVLWPVTPLIWGIFFVLTWRAFGKKALWLLPVAPIAFAPIISYFAGGY